MAGSDTDRREAALDGLRGVAISLVMIRHVAMHAYGLNTVGSDIFLVLSGYLITRSLMREQARTGRIDALTFCVHRLARLMPALALLLAGLAVYLRLTSGVGLPAADVGSALASIMNWSLIWHDRSSLISHLWSLSLQEQFYLAWLIVLGTVIWLDAGLAPVVAAGLAVVSLGAGVWLWGHHATYARLCYGTDTRACELLIGCLAAFVNLKSLPVRLLARAWPAPVALIGAIYVWLPDSSPIRALGGYGVIGLAVAWVLTAIRSGTAVAVFLRWSPLAYVGRISYGLYLWNYPIQRLAHLHGPSGGRTAVLTFVLSAALAAASHAWLETPVASIIRTSWRRWRQEQNPSEPGVAV